MNATKRSAAWIGLVVCSLLAVAVTGCRTHVVHERTRTVYVPAPPPPVVEVPAPVPPPPPPEQPPVVVIQSENDFYEPLAAHGRWVVVGSYGRCWIPGRVEVGWRPYSNGYWQRTDAGWYWVSEEPWGWATYHYGRWDWHGAHGWIWVPHTQWAPAWVAWREGGGYIGWAPLRPSVTIGVRVNAVNYEPAFASRAFVFVEHRRMLEPIRPRTVIVNNTTIINNTVNITNVRIENKTVINEGPRPEVIEREIGRKVRSVPVREFRHREETTVAARERNIPTASQRRTQPPARTEVQPPPKQAVTPRDRREVEKPALVVTPPTRPTPPARPLVTPERPATPPVEAEKPLRGENRREAGAARRITTTPPTVAPAANPEVKPPQRVPPRPEVRPVERPAVPARPTPPPVVAPPNRDEKKREPVVERRSTATTPAVEPRPSREIRPETKRETKPGAKAEAAPTAATPRQLPPPAARPADKRLDSAKEKSPVAERSEANERMKEDKVPKKKRDE